MYHRWIKTALNAVILVGMTAIPARRRPGRILSLPSKGMTSGPFLEAVRSDFNFVLTLNRFNEAITIANVGLPAVVPPARRAPRWSLPANRRSSKPRWIPETS